MHTIVRPATSLDTAFVFSSWLRSLRPHAPMLKTLFMRGQHALIESIIRRPGTQVSVLCLEEAPETILGWICWSKGTAHYVYVKADFRCMGFATRLLEATTGLDSVSYTHRTPAVRFFGRYAPVYDPYILLTDYTRFANV